MTSHADSQINDETAAHRLAAALASPEHRSTLRLVRARQIDDQEMLALWSVETPNGPLCRVAEIEVLTGEPLGFDSCYTVESDAITVWEHLVGERALAVAAEAR